MRVLRLAGVFVLGVVFTPLCLVWCLFSEIADGLELALEAIRRAAESLMRR